MLEFTARTFPMSNGTTSAEIVVDGKKIGLSFTDDEYHVATKRMAAWALAQKAADVVMDSVRVTIDNVSAYARPMAKSTTVDGDATYVIHRPEKA